MSQDTKNYLNTTTPSEELTKLFTRESLQNNVAAKQGDFNDIYRPMLPENLLKPLEIVVNSLGWNPDYTLLPMIVTAAAAIGSSRVSSIAGYDVKSILFGCSVGPPAVNKSQPYNFAVKPLLRNFEREFNKYVRDRQTWENLDKDRKAQQPEPQLIESAVSDITVERLGMAIQSAPRGVLMHVSELKGWFGSFERYTKGSNAETTFLSLFDGDPLNVSRITRGNILVENPYLSIIGTTQPDTIYRAFHGHTHNGLKERILYVFPDAAPQPWIRKATDEAKGKAAHYWENIISGLNNLSGIDLNSDGVIHPEKMTFDEGALDALYRWNEMNTERKKAEPDNAAIYGKADITASRLAMILQLIEAPNSMNITLKNAERAIKMTEYFLEHTKKVMTTIAQGPEEDSPPERKLYDSLPGEFTTAEALKIGMEELKLSRRSIYGYLKDKQYFKRNGHGKYGKVVL